jgi:hypothetical protein
MNTKTVKGRKIARAFGACITEGGSVITSTLCDERNYSDTSANEDNSFRDHIR